MIHTTVSRRFSLAARALALTAAGSLTLVLGVSAPATAAPSGSTTRSAARAVDEDTGKFAVVPTTRLLDSRTGLGVPRRPVAGGTAVHLQVTGRGGVPTSGAGTVVLNLTVTHATAASGFVTVFPTGTTRPASSNLNFTKGWTGANSVTVRIGSAGRVDLYLSAGTADLIADVIGWYVSAATVTAATSPYHPVAQPFRIMDTRSDGGKHQPLLGHYEVELGVAFGGVTNTTVRAVAINLTATNVSVSGGYLHAYSGLPGQLPWSTSTLNLQARTTTPNLAIVQSHPCTSTWCANKNYATFNVYNGSAHAVDVLVDIVGFYSVTAAPGATRFQPLATPVRIVDTRTSLGTTPMTPASTHLLTVPSSVATFNTAALATNVTAVQPTATTFLTLWPALAGVPRPPVSNLNPKIGSTVANGALVPVGTDQGVNVYNSSGTTDFLLDVAGTFENFPAIPPPPKTGAGGSAPTLPGVVGHGFGPPTSAVARS